MWGSCYFFLFVLRDDSCILRSSKCTSKQRLDLAHFGNIWDHLFPYKMMNEMHLSQNWKKQSLVYSGTDRQFRTFPSAEWRLNWRCCSCCSCQNPVHVFVTTLLRQPWFIIHHRGKKLAFFTWYWWMETFDNNPSWMPDVVIHLDGWYQALQSIRD